MPRKGAGRVDGGVWSFVSVEGGGVRREGRRHQDPAGTLKSVPLDFFFALHWNCTRVTVENTVGVVGRKVRSLLRPSTDP